MSTVEEGSSVRWKERLQGFVQDVRFQRAIIGLIVVNAVILGLETHPGVMSVAGDWLTILDHAILAVFVVEIGLRLGAYGWRFFRDAWSVFDFLIVGIALLPFTETFAVLRALRILRALRMISVVPRMRRVVEALLAAVPGLGSVVALLCLIFYVAGVMATHFFGAAFPEWFGTLPKSIYSLFQIMTLESWSMGIVRPVMDVYPYAWVFFVPFILISTFTMLNLFIAVIVSALETEHYEEQGRIEATHAQDARREREVLLAEIRALREELRKDRNPGEPH